MERLAADFHNLMGSFVEGYSIHSCMIIVYSVKWMIALWSVGKNDKAAASFTGAVVPYAPQPMNFCPYILNSPVENYRGEELLPHLILLP